MQLIASINCCRDFFGGNTKLILELILNRCSGLSTCSVTWRLKDLMIIQGFLHLAREIWVDWHHLTVYHGCIKPSIMSYHLGMSEISSAHQYPGHPLLPWHGAGLHFQAACREGVPCAWVLADELWTENPAEDPKAQEMTELGRKAWVPAWPRGAEHTLPTPRLLNGITLQHKGGINLCPSFTT